MRLRKYDSFSVSILKEYVVLLERLELGGISETRSEPINWALQEYFESHYAKELKEAKEYVRNIQQEEKLSKLQSKST